MKYGIYTLVIENYITKNSPLLSTFSLKMEFGWGNGYILIPNNHPSYGVSYDDMNTISVHGGLTYGQFFDSKSFLEWIDNLEIDGDVTIDNYKKLDNYWMIGFDTNHYGDSIEKCSKEYVIHQSEYLMEQCLNNKIEGVMKYKLAYSRKEKLKNINQVIKNK